MKTMLLLAAAGFCAFLASCSPVTPQGRIQQSPQLFAGLPEKHKALVEHGHITEGMSPGAVYLAWGKADQEYYGSEKGKATMRWDYTSERPVYSTGFWGGYGYGGYGPYGYRGSYFGIGPEVVYIPYESGRVLFINNRVTKWERVN